MKAKRYHVISLDVWGNEDDGFEVNDRHRIGWVEVDDTSDEAMLDALRDAHFLNAQCRLGDKGRFRVRFDWSDETWCQIEQSSNGYPLLQLEAEEDPR